MNLSSSSYRDHYHMILIVAHHLTGNPTVVDILSIVHLLLDVDVSHCDDCIKETQVLYHRSDIDHCCDNCILSLVLLLFVDVHIVIGAATTWIMHTAFVQVGVKAKSDLCNINVDVNLNLMLTATSDLTSTLIISLSLMIRSALTSSFRRPPLP